MQSASVNYLIAASGAGGVWADPQLQADWFGDGFSTLPSGPFTSLITRDDFDRTVFDSLGHNRIGRQWTSTGGNAAEYWVSAGEAFQGHPTVNVLHANTIELGDTNFDITCTVRIPPATAVTSSISALWVAGRYADSSNYYAARLDLTTSGSITLALHKRVAGSLSTVLAATTIGTHIANRSWTVQFRGVGSSLQARAWRTDAEQPATWSREATDTSLTAGTKAGFLSRLETGNTNTLPVNLAFSAFRATSPGIDDLSGQVGSWTVQHHLDDGYPDSVTFISGVGVPELGAELGPPPPYLTGTPMQVAEYYSPYNVDSPIYGLDRDVAPVTLDHGVITSDGPERIRIFTGQMLDIPVKRGRATLSATSATRLALAKLVQPPSFAAVFNGSGSGLNGSWPVSWALAQCGLYVSPPPRDGCRWWTPMHGSTRPFLPAENITLGDVQATWGSAKIIAGANFPEGSFPGGPWRPEWITGPYLLAPDCQLTATESRRITVGNIEFDDGEDLLSQAGNKARLEFWVRGDATNVNNAPGGSGNVSKLAGIRSMTDLVASRGFHMGLDNNRKVFVYANDGAGHSSTLTSDDTLPTDGEWYFVGAAYDITAKKLWVTNFAGTTKSSTVASFVTSSLPTTDVFTDYPNPSWVSYLPVAEIQLTAGAQANVDNYPTWLNGIPFTPSVVMTPSTLELVALAEPVPREAWEFISSFAQADTAAMRTDENDIFQYLGPGWWVRDAQQVVTEELSTEHNTASVDVNIDPTKVRNTIRVSYDRIDISETFVPAYKLNSPLTIPPGVTDFEFPFSVPVVGMYGQQPQFFDDTDLGVITLDGEDYVTLNTASDGSGTFLESGFGVTISKPSWHAGAVVWRFTNNTNTTYYTANSVSKPALQVVGATAESIQAYVIDANDDSVTRRGERSLPVTATGGIQSSVDARRLARILKMGLCRPVPITEELELFGDARRQPGDLVEFADPSMTKVSGLWRRQSVTHEYSVSDDEVSYTQRVILRPTLPICVVGAGIVGRSLVGPAE